MDTLSRQDYIRAAVTFLKNPQLVDSPLSEKLKFLRDKGLTDVEVDEALNLALVDRHKAHSSRWNFFVILGLCFSAYKLYKAYVETQADEGVAINDTKDEHKIKTKPSANTYVPNVEAHSSKETESSSLNEILEEVRALKTKTDWCKSSLSEDIKALQTLLLGHEKLAAPPMIPAWQMSSSDSSKSEDQEAKSKTSS